MNLEHAPNPRGEAVAMMRDVDSTMKNDHGVFWQASIERLSKMVKERVPQSRQSLQEWLPDLDAVVEAQFDSVNKKKEWYKGIVKAINHDDSMTVLFASNVSERNIHPDKVRLVGGKPPKIKSRYPSAPADGAAGFKVGDAVQAPFEGNVKKLHEGTIAAMSEEQGTCDVTFRFNPNVTEHGIPVSKIEKKLEMDPVLLPKKRALEKVMRHADAKDFLKPVMELWPPHVIPGYAEIVRRPMDLGTVKKNLANGLYNDKPLDMLADMELVFHNCQTYTQGDTGSEYYIKAGRMLEVVRTAFHNAEADNARGQKRKASAGGSAAAAKRPAAASEVSQPKRPTTLAEILAEVKALAPMVDKGDMEYAQKEALLGEINSLEEEEVNGVIDVIKVAESIVDDAEIDLGELQDSTMWKLRHFVDEVKRMKSAR